MTFEEWYKRKYLEEPLGLIADVTRDAWYACLEHAREEFLQREIDRLRTDSSSALESGVIAHKERFYSYHPSARIPYCIVALEYLNSKPRFSAKESA